jgi:hypothetical protein
MIYRRVRQSLIILLYEKGAGVALFVFLFVSLKANKATPAPYLGGMDDAGSNTKFRRYGIEIRYWVLAAGS